MTILTITAKGQITLTRDLLQHLNVASDQKVEVSLLPDGRFILEAAKQTGSIDKFSGSLETTDGPRLTVAQIKKITKDARAGKR
jgi:antitoxin PrlF